MNPKLLNDHHVHIKGFVDPARCKKLSREFKEHTQKIGAEDDDQVPGSISMFNFVPFIQLLCEKTKEVAEIVGEGVIPSYVYSRIYLNGNELKRHLDRKESEIAISVNMDCDKLWPLWLETPSGEKLSYLLEPGDALIYLGMDTPHWREPFEGEYCNNAFLFYVLAEGPYRENYFDRVTLTQDAYKDFLREGQTAPAGSGVLSEYVRLYSSGLSQHWCNEIIKLQSMADSQYIDNYVSIQIGFLLKRYSFDTSTNEFFNDSGYHLATIPPGGELDILRIKPSSENRLEAVIVIALTDGVNSSILQKKMSPGEAMIHPWNFMCPSSLVADSEEPQKVILTWVY